MLSLRRNTIFIAVGLILVSIAQTGHAESFKPEKIDPAYEHNRWKTPCKGITRDFAAFKSCFDDEDDDNKDGVSDIWGVPEWVSYEMRKINKKCLKTSARPGKWFGDEELIKSKIMPADASYAYPKKFLGSQRDWYSRGHLAMKMHAERLGAAEGWNTHTFYNAVPQRQLFNAGIWLDLEYLTAAWAQEYGAVWVITGPIFADRTAFARLGEAGETPVAIPDALFKLVVKVGSSPERPDVLAFIYPQVGPGYYGGKPYNHLRYLTTVDEVEKLTGIDFFSELPAAQETALEKMSAEQLWAAKDADFIPVCKSASSGLNE